LNASIHMPYSQFLRQSDTTNGVGNRKVLLLMDECPAHPPDTGFLNNVKNKSVYSKVNQQVAAPPSWFDSVSESKTQGCSWAEANYCQRD